MAKQMSDKYSKTIIRPECRICLKKDGTLPIFGDESKPDISMEIYLFADIQVDENDDLPKLICESCFKLLEGAILFRRSAKRSNAILKRRKTKTESAKEQPSSSLKTENKPKAIAIYFVPAQSQIANNTEDYLIPEMNNETTTDLQSIGLDETLDDDISYILHVQTDENIKNDDVSPSTTKKKRGSNYCKYCSVSFLTSDDLEGHRSTIEHKKNYVKSFLPKSKSTKDQRCEFCNEFFTKVQYPSHMLLEHDIKVDPPKKKCNFCNEMLHSNAFNYHLKTKHGSQTVECSICNKVFSKDSYPLHLQRHKQGDSKEYVCDQCGKKFFLKSSFLTHKLIHSNALPHKCEYCPYKGRTRKLLNIHMRSHTGDCPYKCTQCDTRCSTKSNLNCHMRTHRGPIDFICDACNRGFYTKLLLERHISVVHYGIKNHICSVCDAAFGYRQGLLRHQQKVHKKPKSIHKGKPIYLQLD